MKNACLPYPGRQIFLGALRNGQPAFGYLVTGRRKESQERKAVYVPEEHAYRMLPLDPDTPFDPLRHYQAVRIDPDTGIAIVSNSQMPVDPLLNIYKAMLKSGNGYSSFRLRELLREIGPEHDSYKTPRIASASLPMPGGIAHVGGIVTSLGANEAYYSPYSSSGKLHMFSTYLGDVENPQSFPAVNLFEFTRYTTEVDSLSAHDLAEEIYESSYADNPRGDLRVSSIAGISDNAGKWDIKIKNRF